MTSLVLVIGILVLVLAVALIFSRTFRHWLNQHLTAAWLIIRTFAPVVGRFLRMALTTYGLIILVAAWIIFLLLSVSLLVGWPVLTGVCFLLAIVLFIIAWLPAGIITRLLRINSAVLPPSIKAIVAYSAFFGFLAFTNPEVMNLKLILGAGLIGFMSIGLSKKIKFLDKVAWPVVLFICLSIGWNFFFPDNFRATTKWVASLINVFSADRDRNTINNNASASVTYGKLREDVNTVYRAVFQNDTIAALAEISLSLKKDSIIKVVNHKSKIQNFDGAGFIQIQLAKKNGSFVGGRKVWIEADRIKPCTRREIKPGENIQDTPVSSVSQSVTYIYPETAPYYKLGPNEATGWLNIPHNSLTISHFSTDNDYWLVLGNGHQIFVKKGDKPPFPEGNFKLKATDKEVTVEIQVS